MEVQTSTGLGDMVYLIARIPNREGHVIDVQDFIRNGEAYIPVFSDKEGLQAFVRGTKYERWGLGIDTGLLFTFLRGDELLVLNPQSLEPRRLGKADLDG
ncbi:MAG TPA: hypothetical protein VL460_04940 [Caulobacteraceae bacterium]|jgi:hypothetical protein|nr:hypothetical protein [Caulobacteraceae bacterium]